MPNNGAGGRVGIRTDNPETTLHLGTGSPDHQNVADFGDLYVTNHAEFDDGVFFDNGFCVGTTCTTAEFGDGNIYATGTASISGALKLYGTPTIQSTANQSLTLGGDTTGDIVLNGDGNNRVGIGTDTPADTLTVYSNVPSGSQKSGVGIFSTITDGANYQNGWSSSTNVNPSTASTMVYPSLKNIIDSSTGTNVSGATLVGMLGGIYYTASSGTLGTAMAIQAQNEIAGNGTINDSYGLYITDTIIDAGGSVDNSYGAYIVNQSAGGSRNTNLAIGGVPASGDYSIYNASTYDNYFEGNLYLGSTTNNVNGLAINGDDLVVNDDLGVNGDFYVDGSIYLNGSNGSNTQCLLGGATPFWGSCASGGGGGAFAIGAAGVTYQLNDQTDLLIGGTSTPSAKFAITNVIGSNVPVASLSATTASGGSGNGIVLDANGSIQTLRNNTLTIGGNTTGGITIDSGTTGTIGIGTNTSAKTINIGTGGTGIKTIAIGGSAANVITLGNTQTAGSITAGTAMTTGTLTLGGTAQTGTQTFGRSTATNTINIGNGNTATGNTQSINIGAGTPAGTGLTNINIGNTLNTGTMTLRSGTGGISLNTSGTGAVSIGNTSGDITLGADTITASSLANFTTAATLTLSGDLVVSGDNLDSAGAPLVLNATANDEVRIGDAGTPTDATGDGDLFVSDALEVDGTLYLDGAIDAGGSTGAGQCLMGGASSVSWGTCGGGGAFSVNTTDGTTIQNITSTDLLLGGVATASAKFAFIMNSVDSPSTGNPSFRVYDPTSTNYLEIYNDGTNSYIRSNTGDVVLGSGSGGVNIEDAISNENTTNNGFLVFADKVLHQATEGTGNALYTLDQLGAGDLFTASASGTTVFTINTNGDID